MVVEQQSAGVDDGEQITAEENAHALTKELVQVKLTSGFEARLSSPAPDVGQNLLRVTVHSGFTESGKTQCRHGHVGE